MVAAPVAVFQFVGICTGGQGHKLVAQADGKDRHIRLIQFADFLYNLHILLGVPGAVGQHDAVGPVGQNLLRPGVRGIYGHLAAADVKGTGNIFLGAQIQKGHPLSLSGKHICFFAGNLHALDAVGPDLFQRLGQIGIHGGGDHTVHGSFFS